MQEGSGEGLLPPGGAEGSSISSALKEMLQGSAWEAAACDNTSQHPQVAFEWILGCKGCLLGQSGWWRYSLNPSHWRAISQGTQINCTGFGSKAAGQTL